MSLAEIEAEIEKLKTEELRQLALTSWKAFLKRESSQTGENECSEDDPQILAALDEAIEKAQGTGLPANEVRTRLSQWTSK
jgi:hypothetical protein